MEVSSLNMTIIKKEIATIIILLLLSINVTAESDILPSQVSLHNEESSEQLRPQSGSEEFIDNLIKSLMSLAQIPALSAAIIKDDEIVWTKGYGIYDRENNKIADADTIYLVASISKTFTATAVMQLYEQGYFDLDDDVNDYLPFSLRNPSYPDTPISFRMLLAHQSSIASDLQTFNTRAMPGDLEISGYPSPYHQELLTPTGIHYRPQVWNNYHPGDDMYYANIGYSVLGHLVEQISGQSFEGYCREHIFAPLEMNDTSFRLTNVNISRAAVPYWYVDREYYPYLHYNILEYPAGGLRTSILDLSRFLILHMNNGTYGNTQILTPESVEEMQTIQYPSDTYQFQYGLGFQIWETRTGMKIGHTGGLYGVATKMVYKKSNNIGIIMFTNAAIENLRDNFAFSMIEQLLFLKGSRLKTTQFMPRELLESMLFNNFLSEDFQISDFPITEHSILR